MNIYIVSQTRTNACLLIYTFNMISVKLEKNVTAKAMVVETSASEKRTVAGAAQPFSSAFDRGGGAVVGAALHACTCKYEHGYGRWCNGTRQAGSVESSRVHGRPRPGPAATATGTHRRRASSSPRPPRGGFGESTQCWPCGRTVSPLTLANSVTARRTPRSSADVK